MSCLTRILTALVLTLSFGFCVAGPINLNTADANSIAKNLDGVGLVKAKAIVQYRKQHGNFSSLEELTAVKGIGDKTLDRNRDRISLTTRATSK